MTATIRDAEIDELRRRLEEAEETLRAIRSGEVDALVVDGPEGERVYTLQGADHSYRVLIEAMQQGAASLNSDGTVLYCNRSFADLLNAPHEKIVGASIARFIPAAYRALFEAMLREGQTGVSHGELRLETASQTLRPVHVALNPLALVDGSAICMIVTDLTERKEHQDLQDVNRRKDEFLAMLAHELRNPLAPILHAAAILDHLGNEDENLAYAREIIERQAHHLSRLVDDLLDVSRITLGKVQLHKERTDLAAIVERAVETSKPTIDARRHRLKVSLPPMGLRLEADATRLAQVISNLLTNAAKYTDEGGLIFLTADRQGSEVAIRVRDTGMGIPAELLPRVFELFIQGDRSLARSEGGLGIGLTLVRQLVELHGGTVEAFSEGPGRGSEFVVRLPALASEPQPGGQVAGRRNDPNGLAGRRILLVEDNKDGADSLALLLKMMGHEVSIAYTGPEAIGLAQAICPQAVLLDIGLPGMTGYEVARQLRKLPGCEKTVLVAMTGYGQDDDRQRSRDAGFNHHLVKPVDLGTLNEVLESLVTREGSSARCRPSDSKDSPS